jgi:uncharacterized delta-60 repeat protein
MELTPHSRSSIKVGGDTPCALSSSNLALERRDLTRPTNLLVAFCCFIQAVAGFTSLNAQDLATALDTTSLIWTTGGNSTWFGQTNVSHDAFDAAQSGPITHNQQSWLEATVTGPSTILFWWKVSSESGYDFLSFYINGALQGGRISGEVNWQLKTFDLPSGNHTLRWTYTKDGSDTSGQDRGWVDMFTSTSPTGPPVIVTQPQSQTIASTTSAGFTVLASGQPPLAYQWVFNGTNLANGGRISGATTNTLTIATVQPSDAGYYSVLVSNLFGSVTSQVALLTVVAPPFNPGANDAVQALAQQADGRILVGGNFTALGGQTRNRIGRLNPDGALDATFNLGANAGLYSLAVQADGKILVGGEFTTLGGQSRNRIGRLDPDGTLDATFNPGASSTIYSLALQADGKILAGGDFTTLGGQTRNRIGRLNPDGTLDATFNPGANSFVYALAFQADGKILVGGNFTALGGQPRNRIGRLNPDGTLDNIFDPGANDFVISLAVQADGKILVGGWFTTLGGQSRSRIGRLDSDSSLDLNFNPRAGSVFPWVNALAVQADGKILVGGSFGTLSGQTRNNIGRLTADGTLDPTFNPGAAGEIISLALQADGKILVGGNFTTLDGQLRNSIGRLDNTARAIAHLGFDGSTITWLRGATSPEVWRTSFDFSTNGLDWVNAGSGVRITGGWQLTGLDFPTNATIRARGFVSGHGVSSWFVESSDGPVTLTSQPTSQTVNWGGTVQFSVTAAGTSPSTYQWRKDGVLLADATNAYLLLTNVQQPNAGGYYVVVSNLFGAVTSAVATLTVREPVITALEPPGQSANVGQSVVFEVSAAGTPPFSYQWRKYGTNLYGANGPLLILTNVQSADLGLYDVVVTSVFGSATSQVAVLTINLVTTDSFNPTASGWIHSLAVQADGKILVGGDFFELNGQPRYGLGRLTPDGTLDPTFNPGADGGVYALAVQADSRILVGGDFTTLSGQTRNRIGRLNPGGDPDTTFNVGASSTINSLAVQADDKILVGGAFTTLGGQTRNRVGRLNPDGTLDTTFNPGANDWVNSLAVAANGKILVGGNFTTLGGQTCNYIGRLNADGTLDPTVNPLADAEVYCLAVQPDGKTLVGGAFTTLGGQARNCIGRLNPDGTLDATFNPAANDAVLSLSLQADGKILVGGDFTMLGGQVRNKIGRLNPDGTLDPSFDPGANDWVYALAVQTDGKILLGGSFTTLGGETHNSIGRLNNTEAASQNLMYNGSTLTWLRGGTSPEVWRTTFDYSIDGTNWTSLGAVSRISNGWQRTGVSMPANARVRAQGFAVGGHGSVVVEMEVVITPPLIIAQPIAQSVASGQSVEFSVGATGTLPLAYQWYKDGMAISGETNTSLTLFNVQNADDGVYSVVITNTIGAAISSNAVLTVILPLPVALDTTALTWTSAGSVAWLGQVRTTHDGVDAAQSGVVSHNEQSWLETAVTGPGTLSFWWKVSSEFDFDFLEFRTNGSLAARISGEEPWQQQTFSLGNGLHVLRWRYAKDQSASFGGDLGWLDELLFTSARPTILIGDGNLGMRSNRFGFNLSGQSGQVVVVEGSSNLVIWTSLITNTLGGGPHYFSDRDATNFSQRFYRARLLLP